MTGYREDALKRGELSRIRVLARLRAGRRLIEKVRRRGTGTPQRQVTQGNGLVSLPLLRDLEADGLINARLELTAAGREYVGRYRLLKGYKLKET